MTKTNFILLKDEYPILYNIGHTAEHYVYEDPVTSLFKIRQFVERLTALLFAEHGLSFAHDDSVHTRLKTLAYKDILPGNIRDLLFTIKNRGNQAVHSNQGDYNDAMTALLSAFKVSKWFFSVYAKGKGDTSGLRFKAPEKRDARLALATLETAYKALEEKFEQLLAQKTSTGISTEESNRIINKGKAEARKYDMNEAQTRILIDQQLAKNGWEVDSILFNYKTNKTLPQGGKNIAIAEWKCAKGWADYALFVGTKLYAIVEAKKYKHDISSDLTQAKRYATDVQAKKEIKLLGKWRSYKVPFIFSTNGREFLEQLRTKSGIWFLDLRQERNLARPLQGWMSPDGLVKLYAQDIQKANKQLAEDSLDYLQSKAALSLRDYQIKAIRKVEERLINEPENRKALLAMATGTGKTRTILGLCYRLIKSDRFQRILFLVDRRLLAGQAFDSFKDTKVDGTLTFADVNKMEGLKDLLPDIETRLHFATVQGMVNRLFIQDKNSLPVDSYDCIIVDEAHRGYLLDKEMDEEELNFKNQQDYVSKYRRVLDYFDAFCVALTATPALHTREIFGAPVFTYSYREAVIDGFLIDHEPPTLIQTRLNQEGMLWEKGEKPKVYEVATNQIIELEELEDELHIEIENFNRLVITESFNRTVIQQLVKVLDPEGAEKTLIFAARDAHADMVVDLMKEEFDKVAGVPDDAIMKITGKTDKVAEMVRRFKNEKYPNIVVTVDLLTTGIDVPAICNLVFLRRIRSRILYEQMVGRATRLCPEINKEVFRIFDAVRIYEALQDYTQMKPVTANPKASFQQLVEEMQQIESEERIDKQIDQLIAKLQVKKRYVVGNKENEFAYRADGKDPEDFIQLLHDLRPQEAKEKIKQYKGLWKYLDGLKPAPYNPIVSEHVDEWLQNERGYGEHGRPEDYLENFERFIKENRSKLTALNIICSRPALLDRQSLKELKLALDAAGFNSRSLNTAWKDVKNERIAADIISYIRTLAIGSPLVDHEKRIKIAVDKIRDMRDWSKIQIKWIDRFEAQLLKESVIQKEDLDKAPFKEAGGYLRLNKIFDNELDVVLKEMNMELYRA